jgi:hypothetical protein
MATSKSRISASRATVSWKSPWNAQHYTYIGAAIVVIVVGFLLLAKRDVLILGRPSLGRCSPSSIGRGILHTRATCNHAEVFAAQQPT